MNEHMRSVLILGSTGAMGTHLCKQLDNGATEIIVTSRREHRSDSTHLHYVRAMQKSCHLSVICFPSADMMWSLIL